MSRRDFVRMAAAVAAGAAVFHGGARNESHGAEGKAAPGEKKLPRIGVERREIKGDGFRVPAVLFVPPAPSGAAIIVHGYGGCKEEQLGFAWRIAERGIATCAIDLRGHGEHRLPLDESVMLDVGAAIQHCRVYGKTVAIGHSLGGRLVLLSDADFTIGISPALTSSFSAPTMRLLKDLRGYRVREETDDAVFGILGKLPPYKPAGNGSALIVYGERDVPEIKEACNSLASRGQEVVKIDRAWHADIFLLESTFTRVSAQLGKWLG